MSPEALTLPSTTLLSPLVYAAPAVTLPCTRLFAPSVVSALDVTQPLTVLLAPLVKAALEQMLPLVPPATNVVTSLQVPASEVASEVPTTLIGRIETLL